MKHKLHWCASHALGWVVAKFCTCISSVELLQAEDPRPLESSTRAFMDAASCFTAGTGLGVPEEFGPALVSLSVSRRGHSTDLMRVNGLS